MRRTARESLTNRIRRKLLSKTTRYMGRKKEDHYKEDNLSFKATMKRKEDKKEVENMTVLFVEYTDGVSSPPD